ncbi:histidine kinase dimerization/phospho-acceptor domain-containing protein [uncultured Parasphingopyxis sp.]|uniref:sensor histidine kinase n=1 Tax=uncultured Parasphingopyxis sp. TaxID=1547918 RepID=UPI00261CB9EE|nr:histidine kinase dimerization/phospho-acceptor domain-containing protein [uncultured Parasphingopyxis sp.]
MRFDDMLATVLAQPRTTAAARIAVWRQLVDLLAQRDDVAASPQHIDALSLLDELRADVPDADRIAAAHALRGRRIAPWLMAFFAEERPEIASPVLLGADLSAEDWIALLPATRPSSRALLRHRRDLPAEVVDQLDRYGAADMILEGRRESVSLGDSQEKGRDEPQPEPENAPAGNPQIKELVARIENFQRERQAYGISPAAARIEDFRFEAGTDGVICWVEGAPREPLIGQTIAFSADALDFGVDGHAAGAFRQRAPFRDARLVVAGEGPASGRWRISAVPFFNDSDGRFAGYRGMARRPRRDEEAAPEQGLFGSGLAPDSLRQLIHELRTPLNAIIGFSEMIEKQLLGPVAESYRERASAIAGEAVRLLRSVDDIDTAARAETDRLSLEPEAVQVYELMDRLDRAHAPPAAARGVDLAIRVAPELPDLAVDPIAAERMLERLLSSTVGLARHGERIAILCERDRTADRIVFRFKRPALLAGRSEDELLDPGYSPEGDWPDAPALGLGFALRLVGNIAQEADGRLDIEKDEFVLHLPAKDASALSGEQRH